MTKDRESNEFYIFYLMNLAQILVPLDKNMYRMHLIAKANDRGASSRVVRKVLSIRESSIVCHFYYRVPINAYSFTNHLINSTFLTSYNPTVRKKRKRLVSSSPIPSCSFYGPRGRGYYLRAPLRSSSWSRPIRPTRPTVRFRIIPHGARLN